MFLLKLMIHRDHCTERSASNLELFFDLVVVVAVALLAETVTEMVEKGHVFQAFVNGPLVFYSVWWAWISFTWFGSAFDNDDWLYRTLSLVQMLGMLVLGKGIDAGLNHLDFTQGIIGYMIIRIAFCAQWLRVAINDKKYRKIALRHAVYVFLVQVGWVFIVFLPAQHRLPFILLAAMCDFFVPALAERTMHIPKNSGHLMERYSLLTLIVLGESLMSITNTLRKTEYYSSLELVIISVASFIIIAGLWWIHSSFENTEHNIGQLQTYLQAIGYFFIFSSATLIATGIELAVNKEESRTHHSYIGITIISISVAIFILNCFILKTWKIVDTRRKIFFSSIIVLILVVAYIPMSVVAYMCTVAVLMIIAIAVNEPIRVRQQNIEESLA